jgi:hypothetical protein
MATGHCPKWGTSLKEDFCRHLEVRCINPNKTDKAYILGIRDRYYPGRPDKTFEKIYRASVAEWQIRHCVNAYNNRYEGEVLFVCDACLFNR